MGEEELRHQPRRIAAFLAATLAMVAIGYEPSVAASKPKRAANAASTTVAPDEATPKTFCDGWANVRNVRASGLTGISALRLQAERYQVLVGLSPSSIKADVVVMSEYFSTTLAMADKPLNNTKQAAKLETLIPKIGDALTAVTRHAVRTCPRSVVLPPSTTAPPIPVGSTPVPTASPSTSKTRS
jgi:hypothetical protein